MSFKDVGAALKDVATHYHVQKTPQFIEDIFSLLAKFLRMVQDFLRELFRPHGGSMDSKVISSALGYLIVFVAVVAVLLALVHLIRRSANYKKSGAGMIRGAVSIEENLDAAGWKNQAEKLAQKSDYRGACRAAYLSLLQILDEKKIAPFAPTKTNYEYAYSLSSRPSVQQTFRQLADLVDVVWFGNKSADREDYQQSVHYLEEVTQAVGKEIGTSSVQGTPG